MTLHTVTELLPHKDQMILIDEVVSFSEEKKCIEVAVNVTEESTFYDATIEGVPNLIAIEYMAQASAALAEMAQKIKYPSAPPRPGILLGTRKLDLSIEKFEVGKRYFVSAKDVFDDGTTASFECAVKDESGEIVATAALTAYRPEDFTEFLKERINV